MPLPGAWDVSSRMSGVVGEFALMEIAVLTIMSRSGMPKCRGSGPWRSRMVCKICDHVTSLSPMLWDMACDQLHRAPPLPPPPASASQALLPSSTHNHLRSSRFAFFFPTQPSPPKSRASSKQDEWRDSNSEWRLSSNPSGPHNSPVASSTWRTASGENPLSISRIANSRNCCSITAI